jgi:hypothetical protein
LQRNNNPIGAHEKHMLSDDPCVGAAGFGTGLPDVRG